MRATATALRSRRGLAVHVAGVVTTLVAAVALPPGQAWAATSTISSAGPLTTVGIGSDLSCSATHTGDSRGEFFGGNACGTFLAVEAPAGTSTVYGPDVPAGRSVAPYTPVSQSGVTGAGTAANPYRVVTVVDVAGTRLRLTESDTYVVGQETYRTDVTVANTGSTAATGFLYRAGDCYLQDSDSGFGRVDPVAGSVACATATAGGRIEGWSPITSGSHYLEASYSEVWSAVGSARQFPDTCRCEEGIDNGAGLSWSVALAAGASRTFAHLTTFSPLGTVPLQTDKVVDDGTVASGGSTGYTITVGNPNDRAVSVARIYDDLPAGFTYRPGSTTGATTADPTISGQRLTWTGPFPTPAGGRVAVHFGATVATAAATYYNNAGAAAGTTAVTPTGDTAPVVVTAAAGLRLGIGNVAVVEGDEGTTPAVFTVTLSRPSSSAVTASYRTVAGTAKAPADLTATSGVVTVPAGSTSATIIVPVKGEVLAEPDERFTVVLSAPTGATLSRGTGTGTVLNDD